MKATIRTLLAFLFLVSAKTFAISSTCYVGDPPGSSVNYITPYHYTSWSFSDYLSVRNAINPITPEMWQFAFVNSGPQKNNYYQIVGGGNDLLYESFPFPGLYTVDGAAMLGYQDIDTIFQAYQFHDCWNSGVVYGPPEVDVTISASPIMTGQSTRITWATSTGTYNYATNCTFNGGTALPITSGTSVNGYYQWYPVPGDAITYTITCTGPGGSGSDAVTLTVNHPTGETTTYVGPGSGVNATMGQFSNNLTPSSKVFTSMQVTERFGTVTDQCYMPGGSMPQITAGVINLGTWDVLSPNNTWGPDVIGFPTNAIDQYRLQGSAPCTLTLPQFMDVVRTGGNVNYASNTVSYQIRSDRILVARNGVTQTIFYP